MNIVVVFAGGTGQRMNTKSKPKQFLKIHGKPVLIYTLEHFQNHEQIDGIIVVCLQGWISYCEALIQKYDISKVCKVVPGGRSGQESIFYGLHAVCEKYGKEAIVLIHDGVRPLINGETITKCLQCVAKHGNAITVSPAIETVFIKKENGTVGNIFQRASCEMAKAPQCFFIKDIYEVHVRAQKEGKDDFIDSASMMQYYGHELFTVIGPAENIKITTPVDFYIFRALLDAKESLQILGL